jgi:hypothetical protein
MTAPSKYQKCIRWQAFAFLADCLDCFYSSLFYYKIPEKATGKNNRVFFAARLHIEPSQDM